MASIGIDLGKKGGIVSLRGDGALLGWARTPLAGKEYDGFGMEARLVWILDRCAGEPVRAFIEAPVIMKLRAPQAFSVGEGCGRWMQALQDAGIGFEMVQPLKWVRFYLPAPKRKKRGPDDPKETDAQADERRMKNRLENKKRLLERARRLHPTGIPWDSLNQEARSGVADALLIAEYGRRAILGT